MVISEFSICICYNPLWTIFPWDLCIDLTVSHFLFIPIYACAISHKQSYNETSNCIIAILPFPFFLSISLSMTCLWLHGCLYAHHCWEKQHWNLVNIVFMVAKLGNICFRCKICVQVAVWPKTLCCALGQETLITFTVLLSTQVYKCDQPI